MRIVYETNDGVAVVIPNLASGLSLEEIIRKDVPDLVRYEVVDDDAIPTDRTFRGAWKINGKRVDTDLATAKEIAHEKRRKARDREFEPLDRLATIPSRAEEVEAQRQAIRDKYAALQTAIDSAASVEQLKAALG